MVEEVTNITVTEAATVIFAVAEIGMVEDVFDAAVSFAVAAILVVRGILMFMVLLVLMMLP